MDTSVKDLSMEPLFTSSQVLKAVNITYRQLSYWELKGIIKPTYQKFGTRDFKRYTQEDIATLKRVKELLDEGYSLPSTDTLKEIAKRKEMEEKLKESERRYRDLFENANDIILSIDAEGNIVYFNRMLSELTGYSEEELKSMNYLRNLISPDFREKTKGYLKQLAEGSIIKNAPQCYIKKNGERLYLEFNSTPICDENGNFLRMRCILRDISERKKTEENLKQRVELEKTISHISSRFVSTSDIDDAINLSLAEIGNLGGAGRSYLFLFRENNTIMDNTHEWCAQGVNPQTDNLKNLPCDMFPWWMRKLYNGEIIHIKDVSKLPLEAKAEKEILEKQDIKSLLVLPLNIKGKLAGFIGFDNVIRTGEWSEDDLALLRISSEIIGNVLERKKAEEELQRYRLIVESAHDAMFTKDLNGYYTLANSKTLEVFGQSKEEVLGKTDKELLPPEDTQVNIESDQKVFQTGQAVEIIKEIHSREKSWVFHAIKIPQYDEKGNIIGLIGIARDITERMKAEEKKHQKAML